MTKRLQVLIDDDELLAIQRLARRERVTTAEWVRQRLREAHDQRGRPAIASKLEAIHRVYQLRAPAPDIGQMLDEIEQGYRDQAGDR